MNNLKWLGTFFVLIGILLTNINIYPLNIFFHGFGVVGFSTCAAQQLKPSFVLQFSYTCALYIDNVTAICVIHHVS